MIDYEVLHDFIALVTDGQPISEMEVCSHCGKASPGAKAQERKRKFLGYGKLVLHWLSLRLGCFGLDEQGKPFVSVNEAGPVVSGTVYLEAPHVRVTFYANSEGFSYFDPKSDNVGGRLPWNALLDVDACAREVNAALDTRRTFAQGRNETGLGQFGKTTLADQGSELPPSQTFTEQEPLTKATGRQTVPPTPSPTRARKKRARVGEGRQAGQAGQRAPGRQAGAPGRAGQAGQAGQGRQGKGDKVRQKKGSRG